MKSRTTNLHGAWGIYLLAGLLATGGYFLLSTPASQNLVYALIGASGTAAIVVGIRARRPERVLPWWLLALGLAISVVGDLVWTYYEVALGTSPHFPALPDALYLVSYPTVAAGMVLLVGRKGARDWSALVDPLIIATGVGFLSWVLLIKPYAEDASLSLSERLVSVSYPLVDVLMIAVIARMLMAPEWRSPSFYFLTLGMAGALASDTFYATEILSGAYTTGDLVDSGWLLYHVFLGAAALHPSMADLSGTARAREAGLTWRRLTLLSVAALTAPAVLAVEAALGNAINVPVIVGGSVAMFGLVIARMAGVMQERGRALRRETVLRGVGEALVAAPDQESIYRASLEAALGLTASPIKEAEIGASFAVGSTEKMTIVAVAGEHRQVMKGLRFEVADLPDTVRESLLDKSPVELRNVELASLRKILGSLATRGRFRGGEGAIGSLLVLPVYVRGELKAAMALTSDTPFSGSVRESLESLATDISFALERAALAEELSQSKIEARYRSLIQNSSDITTILETDGSIRYASPSAQRVLGLDPETLIGTNVLDYVHPNEASRIVGFLTHISQTTKTVPGGEIRFRHGDGSWRWLETTSTNLLADPNIEGIVVNSRDVTARVETTEALREAEARFRSLIENIPAVTYIHPAGDSANLNYMSPQIESLLGYTPEEYTRDGFWLERLHPDDRERIVAEDEQSDETLEPFSIEYRLKSREGRYIWVREEGVVVHDEAGEPRYWQGFLWDISDRKKAEERIQRSQRQVRQLFEQSVDALLVHDGAGRIVDCNSAACRSLGYSKEEMLTLSVGDFATNLASEEERERGDTLWQRTMAGDPGATTGRHLGEHRRKDGTSFPVEVSVGSVEFDGKRMILASARDITERREAEERLREAEHRYRTLIENIPAVTYIQPVGDTDSPTEDMSYISPQATSILGYTPEERLAQLEGSWLDMLHPDDRERVLAEDERTNRTGDPFSVEYRRRVRGGDYIWVRDESALVRDESGNPLYWQGFLWDITDRKEAEKRLIETEAKYRTMVERVPAVTYVHTQNSGDTSITSYISPQIEAVLGYTPEEYASDPEFWKTLLHPDDRERVIAEDERTGETGEPFSTEFRMIARDDRTVWLREEGKLVRGEDGGHQSWHGVMFDITEIKQAEARLRESEERYRLVARATNEAIWDCDLARDLQTWSGAFERMFGYSQDRATNTTWWEARVHPEDRERAISGMNTVLEGTGDSWFSEYRFLKADGAYAAVVDRAHILRDGTGKPVRAIGSMMDVTKRRNAEAKLREAELLYRTLIEQIPVVTYMQEIEHANATFYISPQIEDLLGYTPAEYTSDPDLWIDVLHPDDRARVIAEDERTDRTSEPFEREYRMIHRDGRVVWVRDEAKIVADAEGRPLHWRGVMLDITERKELEDRLSYQAFHDELTGLPNRALFNERLEHALANADRREDSLAVLFMDLDNFKFVNDSLGHEAGDMLLVEMARRIKRCIRPGDTAARLGGDEFTILLEGLDDAVGAAQAATRLLEELEAPFRLGTHQLDVTASIGIAFGGSTDDSPSDLLRNADTALYRAKSRGKAGYAIFDDAMDQRTEQRLRLESDLRRAIEHEEFVLHYQPQMELSTGRIAGYEALVRWDHPQRGLLLPAEFIPLAEETGLIVPIGLWVLREACRQTKRWRRTDPAAPPRSISVNLSARQVQRPELLGEVAHALRENGLEPGALVLEITESAVMESMEDNIRTLRSLREMGVKIAIDDFGTGYSGLAYLKSFPVDTIKVDRAFVEELETSNEAAAIVQTIISLAHTLDLTVIAEGIETSGQVERLRELGCELGQGFYLAYPQPEHEPVNSSEVSRSRLR